MSSTCPPCRGLKTHPSAASTLPGSASIPVARSSHLWGQGNPAPGSLRQPLASEGATSPPRQTSETQWKGPFPT